MDTQSGARIGIGGPMKMQMIAAAIVAATAASSFGGLVVVKAAAVVVVKPVVTTPVVTVPVVVTPVVADTLSPSGGTTTYTPTSGVIIGPVILTGTTYTAPVAPPAPQ